MANISHLHIRFYSIYRILGEIFENIFGAVLYPDADNETIYKIFYLDP